MSTQQPHPANESRTTRRQDGGQPKGAQEHPVLSSSPRAQGVSLRDELRAGARGRSPPHPATLQSSSMQIGPFANGSNTTRQETSNSHDDTNTDNISSNNNHNITLSASFVSSSTSSSGIPSEIDQLQQAFLPPESIAVDNPIEHQPFTQQPSRQPNLSSSSSPALQSSSQHQQRQQLSAFDEMSNRTTADTRARGSSPPQPSSAIEDRELTVEKSHMLEQLRIMNREVQKLEAEYQALKRKRQRIAATALEKRKRAQEGAAREMSAFLSILNSQSIPSKDTPTSSLSVSRLNRRSSIFATRSGLGTGQGLDLGDRENDNHQEFAVTHRLIAQIRHFTNITFNTISSHLSSMSAGDDENDEATTISRRAYTLSGSCFGLEFSTLFVVLEPALVLEQLTLNVPHCLWSEMGTFLVRAEKECRLMDFFRAFSHYAELNYHRARTMRAIATSFPDYSVSFARIYGSGVDGGGGDGIQVYRFNGLRGNLELVLQWTLDTNEHGKVVPRLQLLPRAPSQWKEVDKKGTLAGLTAQFSRLVELKGIEGAAHAILSSV